MLRYFYSCNCTLILLIVLSIKETVGGIFMTYLNLITEKEVAQLIGLSVHWLRRKRWSGGGIPYIKIGEHGAVRYRPEDVDAFVSDRVRKSTSDQGR